MNILVAISSVPDTTSKINFTADGKEFDKNGIQFVINPYDEFCLTRAVWFKEKNGANITVVTVGDASVEPVMRKALAIGADAAIRIEKDPKDSLSVAKEIVEVIKEKEYDLVFFGKESIDYNGAAVHGLVSGILNIPFVNACIGLEVEGNNATAIREVDGGKETVSTTLPLAIAGQKGLVNESDLRIPNMRGIMQARSKPLEVKTAAHQEESFLNVSFESPTPRSNVKLIDPDNVNELVQLLNQEAKVI